MTSSSKPPERGADKLQSKLRMVSRGNSEVSSLRAAQCAFMRSTASVKAEPTAISVEEAESQGIATGKAAKKDYKAPAADARVNVFVQRRAGGVTRPGRSRGPGPPDLEVRTLTLKQLAALAKNPDVIYVEAGQTLTAPLPFIERQDQNPPEPAAAMGDPQQHQFGAGVLIGIIDVGGFDFAHPDFLTAGGKRTRIVRIWDQGEGGLRPPPKGFEYGSELTDAHLNAAIAGSAKYRVPPQSLEPQSSMQPGSHGTHVASITAGNQGICSRADIACVLLSLPRSHWERRRSFYDTTRLADAVNYLVGLADRLKKPLSINISLGTNGHAHDASAAICRWLDYTLAEPGRSISVAAGNAGQQNPAFPGDLGHLLGRVHTSGRLAAGGLDHDIEWMVYGDGSFDSSENELELWYSPQDRIAVSLRSPDGNWSRVVEPGEFFQSTFLPNGTVVSVYNEIYHQANGCNTISVYLSPQYVDGRVIVGMSPGRWVVRLHARQIRDGSFHGWIERDDPSAPDPSSRQRRFPSYFSDASNVPDTSISSLACSHRVIAVANLDQGRELINTSSSRGPTRDGRTKPDVAAPGTKINAANGFAGPERPWLKMTGTSMASPYVAGVAGLMLAVKPDLTAAQIEAIMRSTSRPLPGADFRWLKDAGYGRIDPGACLKEAAGFGRQHDMDAGEGGP